MRFAVAFCLLAVAGALGADPDPSAGDSAPLYETRCASCHSGSGASKAPALSSLKQMSAARVFFSLSNGAMKAHVAGLSFPEILQLVAFASAGEQPEYTPPAEAMCASREADTAKPLVTHWALDVAGSRALGNSVATLDATNVAKLELAWAFGLPGTTDTRSQPVATEHTLFVASAGGHVFALDRRSGCVRWHTRTPVRTSLTLGSSAQGGVEIAALFFGDTQGFATALAAADGRVLWRRHVGISQASMLTGAITQVGSKLIAPLSSIEVALAANPTHECCKSHGAVSALSADTGERLWTTPLAAEAKPTAKSAIGVQLFGPSGVPVWSAPLIDAKRGLAYVGTGENYSAPATDLSDAIIALRIEDGAIAWHFQAHAGDTYNASCDAMPPGPNCPSPRGPDFDFGASVALARDSKGRELLLAGQKSGDVWALDPDARGKVVWRQRVGAGSALGGVHWGIAVSKGSVLVPISDPAFPIPGYEPRPGLYALAIDDGEPRWSQPIERGCVTDLVTYFQRTALYPDCAFYFGLSAAPTVVGDVVFAGALDGKLRAFALSSGEVLWSFDTAREFKTVNGVPAHGGSIDAAGPIAVGGMLYAQSGYGLFGGLPGNALLGFRVRE
jgi:polyvinyl alcohol dehydrogenase (cytochrome)